MLTSIFLHFWPEHHISLKIWFGVDCELYKAGLVPARCQGDRKDRPYQKHAAS